MDIDEDEGDRQSDRPSPDISAHIREAVDEAFAVHYLPQRAAVADAVTRSPLVGYLKITIPILVGLGTVVGGIISIGERISTISQRMDKALAIASENQGWIKAAELRIVALEYQNMSATRERASLAAQIAQNRDTLATQLDELRKEREASNIKLGRIEGQLDDLRSAVGRLESLGRGGNIPKKWDDARRPPL